MRFLAFQTVCARAVPRADLKQRPEVIDMELQMNSVHTILPPSTEDLWMQLENVPTHTKKM